MLLSFSFCLPRIFILNDLNFYVHKIIIYKYHFCKITNFDIRILLVGLQNCKILFIAGICNSSIKAVAIISANYKINFFMNDSAYCVVSKDNNFILKLGIIKIFLKRFSNSFIRFKYINTFCTSFDSKKPLYHCQNQGLQLYHLL